MHTVYLGLGANIGDRQLSISRAIEYISEKIGCVECQSSLIETDPWGFNSDNRFLNCAIRVTTFLTPFEVLKNTQYIEKLLGREKKSLGGQYHDRIIDIDILLYDDISIKTPTLIIPHPLMTQRDFVMIPLQEVKK